MEEAKVQKSLKDAAKKGEKDVCSILAKEIIRSRRAVNKLYSSKAQLNSVELSMKNQLATLRVSGSLQQSTEVMKYMQALVKVPEIQASMQELSREMMKAGIMEEMIEESFESLEDDDIEEAAQEEVDKILWEVTSGVLGKAGPVAAGELPNEPVGATAASDNEEDISEMQARLEALRS
eukprot:gene12344-2995_t